MYWNIQASWGPAWEPPAACPANGNLVGGSACGMPYAPDDGFLANRLKPLSRMTRAANAGHIDPGHGNMRRANAWLTASSPPRAREPGPVRLRAPPNAFLTFPAWSLMPWNRPSIRFFP